MNPYLHLQIIEQHNALLLAARSHDGATATVPLQLPELDEEAENYGEQLAQALFAGPVRTLYDRCRGAVKGDRRLGIRLALAEVPALDQIRWEWLCLPESRRLLLLDQHTDYVLEPPGLEAIKQRNMGPRQLRMLLVVHSPSEGRGHFEAAPFIDHLANACGEIDFKILAPPESVAEQWQAHYLGRATRHALLEHAGAFSLLHIVAHGSRGTLYLDDGRGGLDRLPPDDLIGHMAHLAEPPQLVFLSSCYSGDGNRHQLARKLVAEAGIPVVIAMRDALPVVLARDLLAPFYRELWRHGQVAKALDHAVLGRGQSRHEPVETVPMVFSRLAGKPLFAQGYYREPTAAELRQGYGKLRELVRERAPDLANHPAVSRHDPLIGEEDLPQLDTLCTRVTDLGFKTLCLGFEPNPQGPNPFPGADPLNEMMEPPGRVDLMKRAWQMLTQRTEGHTLWLSGPAGSGKTSLARGLIHRFRAEIGQPVHQLSEDLPAELAPGLWLCDNPSHIEEILTLPRQRETYLLFVFREGATTLAARPEDHPLLDVPPLRGAALAGALTELATRAGYRVEKALHEAWARESSPRAMTLLARSAQQHWHHRQGAHFPHEAYGQINVAQQVIAAARERWGTPDPDWPLWGPLYRLLTAENQRLSREELLPVTQQTEVVQRLELGLDGGMLAQWESGFQIGNEALAEWPTYQSWLERVAPQLEPLQNLIRRARSWHRHGRKSHDLLPYDDALKKHEAWLEEPRYGRTAIEQAFMEACKTKHRHQTTRRKLALATIIALLSLASIAGVFAYFNAQEARAQKQVAESQRNEAIRHHARYRLERAREYNDRTHYLEAIEEGLNAYEIAGLNPEAPTLPGLEEQLYRSVTSLDEVWILPHPNPVSQALFSPDGSALVTLAGREVRFWRADNGSLLRTFQTEGATTALAFDEHGSRLAVATRKGWLYELDQQGNLADSVYKAHMFIEQLQHDPNGGWVLLGKRGDGYRWHSGNIERCFSGNEVLDLRFEGNQLQALVALEDGSLALHAESDEPKRLEIQRRSRNRFLQSHVLSMDWQSFQIWPGSFPNLKPYKNIVAVEMSSKETALAIATDDFISLYSKEKHQKHRMRFPLQFTHHQLAFDPSGKWLALATDTRIELIDVVTGKTLRSLSGTLRPIAKMVINASARRLVSITNEGIAQLWALEPLPTVCDLGQFEALPLAMSEDGRWLLSGGPNKAQLWNIEQGTLNSTLDIGDRRMYLAEFDSRGERAVSVTTDGSCWNWQTQNGEATPLPLPSMESTFTPTMLAIGREYVVLAAQGKRDWVLIEADEAKRFEVHSGVTSIALSGEAPVLMIAYSEGSVHLWDLETHEYRPLADSPGMNPEIAISEEGHYLATAVDRALTLWDERGNILARNHLQKSVEALYFAPDREVLVGYLANGDVVAMKLPDFSAKSRMVSPKPIQEMRFHQSYMAALHSSGFTVWSLETNTVVAMAPSTATRLAFTASGIRTIDHAGVVRTNPIYPIRELVERAGYLKQIRGEVHDTSR